MVSHRHVAILPLSVVRGKKQIRRGKSSALQKAVSQVAPALWLPDRCPSARSHVLGSCFCRLPAASCHGYVIGTGCSFSMWSSQCEPILNKGRRRLCRSDILPLFTCSWYVLFTASCPIAFDRMSSFFLHHHPFPLRDQVSRLPGKVDSQAEWREPWCLRH